MIYIDVIDRYWNPGSKSILPHLNEDEVYRLHKYLADQYVILIQIAIDTQRYKSKWADLTPGYAEYKARMGYSDKIWIATGQIRKTLRAREGYRKSYIVVGFPYKKHTNSYKKIKDIAKYVEFGTTRMPPRPLFRTAYIYMSKHIGFYIGKFLMKNKDIHKKLSKKIDIDKMIKNGRCS